MHEIDEFTNRFGGIQRLVGFKEAEVLRNSHVCVIGIGGVGSWVVEALARTGVGEITRIDLDEVCINNTNRQLHAMDGEVGKMKVDAMADRVRRINPECKINAVQNFFTERNAEELLDNNFDYVFDAIDSLRQKCILLTMCREKGIPIVTTGGAGGRFDPTQIQVADLARTKDDPLLTKTRKRLRQKHNFPSSKKRKFNIPCVFSTEEMIYPQSDGTVCATREESDEENLRLDCQSGYGTVSFVTGTFAFFGASVIIRDLCKKAKEQE